MTAWRRYPVNEQHYFSGFVLKNEDRAQWARIAAAADAARGRGVAAVFIWALPQACRDGFTYFRIGEDEAVQARSEEHTSELQSLMRISYAVFCLKKKKSHNESKNTKQSDQ